MTTDSWWQDTLAFIGKSQFNDVLVPGIVERDRATPRVLPLFNDVYLEGNHGYLRFSSVGSYGGLRLQMVDSIEFDADLLEELQGDYTTVTLTAQFFGEQASVQCPTATYFTNSESDLENCIVRAIELQFTGGEAIFLDPWCTQGIRLGTAGTITRWLNERPFDPDGSLRQLQWSRKS